jgi:hypothetical protein
MLDLGLFALLIPFVPLMRLAGISSVRLLYGFPRFDKVLFAGWRSLLREEFVCVLGVEQRGSVQQL